MGYTIDIDTGGTFTDGFFSDGSAWHAIKVDTTPHDLTLGLHSCIDQGARHLGFRDIRELLKDTDIIRFSTTLCTNLIVQRRGPDLGLIVTEGFEHSIYGDGGEPIFEFLVKPEMIVGIREELDREGRVMTAPDEHEVARKARYLLERGARLLVISLHRASNNGENERRVKQILDLEYPPHYLGYIPVLLSHQISCRPEDRWRTQASLINAYLHGALMRSLYKAEDDLRDKGAKRPLLVVHTNGGAARVAKTRAVDTYHSGPATALYGAAYLAKQMGLSRVITLDIGGTSTEIGLIYHGVSKFDLHGRIAGLTVGWPIPSLETLGGGGGSIAQIKNGSLEVGPDSAGSLPGPACYGLGGLDPTVTDACVVLGYLDPHYFLGGQRALKAVKAHEAVGNLSSQFGADLHRSALSIVKRLENNVAEGIRRKAGSRNLSDFALFAFGGSGGMHAASIAGLLGIRLVYTFPFGSVFSAFGSSTLDVVHVYESCLTDKGELKNGRLILGGWFQELIDIAQKDMEGEGYGTDEIHYQLQIELSRPGEEPILLEHDVTARQSELSLESPLHASYQIVMVRLRARILMDHDHPRQRRQPDLSLSKALKGSRSVYWKDFPEKTAVYQQEAIPEGSALEGPLLVESRETTVAIPHGWGFRLDDDRKGILERSTI